MVKSNIETFIRIKPNIDNINEMIYETKNNSLEIRIPEEQRKGYVNNLKKMYDFKFSGVFDKKSNQDDLFDKIGSKVIKNSFEGYNNTVFCYGQTGSGKTYTMCGSKIWKERGLIPRILIDIFQQVKQSKNYSYDIYISYLEIYNENAYDLLDRHHSEIELENWTKIVLYEDNYGNIILKNLSMIKVENEQQALDLLMTGNFIRHVSSTSMNLASSRSHAIFTIIIEGRELKSEIMRVSKINLVDLAGSERMRSNLYDQNTVNETKYINLSLSFLEQVIIALNEKSQGSRTHIPYRNSLMTTILKDSLGGNCKTILIANISSDIENIEETISTARFAVRCSKVENEITVNEHMDLNILVHKLNNENQELRKKLEEYETNKYLEIMNRDLSEQEKDKCKLLISDYLNNNKKGLQTSNANQLYYIIDFLIDYVKSREKIYKEKLMEITNENTIVKSSNYELDNKNKKLQEILSKNNINDLDNLYTNTNNKKEGSYESKSSKLPDYNEIDINNPNNYVSKVNVNESSSKNDTIYIKTNLNDTKKSKNNFSLKK